VRTDGALGSYQARDQMTLEQKFAFLCEWADDLADANRSLKIEIHSLLGKILSLDSKVAHLK
jgi:hypothetical protein